MSEKFEIVLTMEGTTPETGNNIQVKKQENIINRPGVAGAVL